MKKHDVVKFTNFSNKFEHFNGTYGIIKSFLPDNKWRVMVNSGKDRAVSITNMDLVKEDLDEKLSYPFCCLANE